MTPATGSDDLCSQLHLDQIDVLDLQGIANLINNALLEPMQEYQPLDSLLPHDEKFVAPVLFQTDVYSVLQKLNPRKASGHDGVSNWILKEFAEILAQPVCSILNISFAKQGLPPLWKMADVVSLIKVKSVTDVSKHLRPISLTPALSKIAEEFIVAMYIGPAILSIIDPDQFGAIPKSSTTHALNFNGT